MPQYRAVLVTLSAGERRMLKKRARGGKTAYRDWLRAQIVLAAARGRASARIAADLHVSVDTVRKWRGRFAARGLDGLADLPRSGQPRRISALERAAVVALACQLPAATGVPLARWTGPELAPRDHQGGAGQPDLTIVGAADPGRAPHQALAVPIVDLPARPGLRRQGHRHPRPVPGVLPGQAAAAGQPGHLGGRQALHPRPAPDAIPRARPPLAGRPGWSTNTSARARWRCWQPWMPAPGRCSLPPPAPPGSPRSWH